MISEETSLFLSALVFGEGLPMSNLVKIYYVMVNEFTRTASRCIIRRLGAVDR